MSLYKTFGTNKALESGGKWFEIADMNADGTYPAFLLARRSSNNTEFIAATQRAQQEHATEISNGTFPVDTDKAMTREIFVDTVLKNWRNVFDANEEPMEYARENAIKLFTDLPDLQVTLMTKSGQLRNYQDQVIAGAAKNLPRPSSHARSAATHAASENKPVDANIPPLSVE